MQGIFQPALIVCTLLGICGLLFSPQIWLFYFTWVLLGMIFLVAAPRRTKSDGPVLAPADWLPARIGDAALFVALILIQSALGSTQWAALETAAPQTPNATPLMWALQLIAVAAAAPFLLFPRPKAATPTAFQRAFGTVGPALASSALLIRTRFLFPASQIHAAEGAFTVLCLAIACALPTLLHAWRVRQVREEGLKEETLFSPTRPGPVTQLARKARTAIVHIDENFWASLWQAPVQLGRSLGNAFVYWQGATAQYTLVVMLIGTLLLFWAALKTQVIW